MSTGTTAADSSADVTLGHKNHWLKFSNFILTKAKAYGYVSKLLTHRVPIDYYQQLVAGIANKSSAGLIQIKSEKTASKRSSRCYKRIKNKR